MRNPQLRILLTGASGFLGHHLADELWARSCIWASAGRDARADVPFDLDDPASAARAVASWRPDVVLHAAAMSSMGACEEDETAAHRRNAQAAAALAATGARVVLVSTDLVFEGLAAPYVADDPPRPISAYGRSKAAGEAAVRAAGGLVVRVPLLLGPSVDGRRGATDMLRSARAEERVLSLFTDEFRTPLHAGDAARALVELCLERDAAGVRHVAGPERISRFDLAERFASIHDWPTRPWEPTSSTDAIRPPDVALHGDRPAERSLDDMLRDS